MKKLKRDIIPLCAIAYTGVFIIFYKFLNNGTGNINSLVTTVDNTIPFLKIFIIPYITWYGYLAIGLIYLCIKHRKSYYTSLISLNIGILACYIIYMIFQTTVPRPIITDSDILSKLVSMIYKNDNPFNCFPSMHVTTTYIIMKGINSNKNKMVTSLSFNIIGILIIISTQFVKQHVVLDLVVAILLSEVVFRVISSDKKEHIITMKSKLLSFLTIKTKLKNPS